IANLENRLVLGASDRSEWLIGYFTKWGDGAADAYPIIGLYKTQVRALGLHLGIPEEVVLRPPTPDLWPGHTAEGELGITYEQIDEVLYRIFDESIPAEKVPEVTGIPKKVVERVLELHKRSEHKRNPLKAPFKSFKELL
ncbi:MAG: NAD(+) synthase, partial [Desulfurococcales archaeon ex4484_42]